MTLPQKTGSTHPCSYIFPPWVSSHLGQPLGRGRDPNIYILSPIQHRYTHASNCWGVPDPEINIGNCELIVCTLALKHKWTRTQDRISPKKRPSLIWRPSSGTPKLYIKNLPVFLLVFLQTDADVTCLLIFGKKRQGGVLFPAKFIETQNNS